MGLIARFWHRVRLAINLRAVDDDALLMVPSDRAAKLAGITRQRLEYWERTDLVRPTHKRDLGPGASVRLYDLAALTELKVASEIVHRIPGRGVGVRQLRPLLNRVRQTHDAPLRTLRWGVEGKSLFFNDGTGWQGGDGTPGQFAFRGTLNVKSIRASLRKQAAPTRAKRDVGRIAKVRGVHASAPVFAGTRIPLRAVWEYLAENASTEEVLGAYPDLHPKDVAKARALLDAARRLKAGASLSEARGRNVTPNELRKIARLKPVA